MKKTKKKHKAKVGDRIWLRIPHNGTVSKVFANGDVRVTLGEIDDKTWMERFGEEEFEIIK